MQGKTLGIFVLEAIDNLGILYCAQGDIYDGLVSPLVNSDEP